MSTFSSFNVFVQLADRISAGISAGISTGISAGYAEGWRRGCKRSALVFTVRLGGVEVELGPLRRRIPLNVARV
jgi:hypothetical protein